MLHWVPQRRTEKSPKTAVSQAIAKRIKGICSLKEKQILILSNLKAQNA